MGREIRRVPPNWQHPRDERGNYIPMFDQEFHAAAEEWLVECIAWRDGTHEDLRAFPSAKTEFPYYWQWAGEPPDPEAYRPAYAEPATWWQVYETVSEGTPVTPAFATKEELIECLVADGDGWDRPVSREAATKFVESGSAPSMVIGPQGIKTGVEAVWGK